MDISDVVKCLVIRKKIYDSGHLLIRIFLTCSWHKKAHVCDGRNQVCAGSYRKANE